MSILRTASTAGILVGLLGLSALAQAQDVSGYLYVTDYGAQKLDRFKFSYNPTTQAITSAFTPFGFNGNTSSAVLVNSNIKEGLQGTANDLIVVDTGGSSLTRYTLDGAAIGQINITLSGSAHTLNSIGNVAITRDGQYMYAPESGAGVIDKIRLSDGVIVAQTAFAGAHDVVIGSDGTVYAAAYTGSSSSGANRSDGIWSFDENLGSKHQLIDPTTNSLTRPCGLSISSTGILYVGQNSQSPTPTDRVFQYQLSNSGGTPVATYIKDVGSTNLHFTFGSDIGPDGNLYIAGLGNGSGRSFPGYTDGVYKYDVATDLATEVIAGKTQADPANSILGTTSGTGGLVAPKYLQFSFNFITAEDPGAPTLLPEGGSVAMFGGLLMSSAGILFRRRLRRR